MSPRITGINSTLVAVPCKKPYVSSTDLYGVDPQISLIIEVMTDDDRLIGVGESPVIHSAEAAKIMVDSCAPVIVGDDPFDIQPIMRKLYARFNLIHFNLHAGNWALSGIEMALWDLVGKEVGKPLNKLWGGAVRKKIPFWAWVARDQAERMHLDARNFLERGFKTLYMSVSPLVSR